MMQRYRDFVLSFWLFFAIILISAIMLIDERRFCDGIHLWRDAAESRASGEASEGSLGEYSSRD